MKPTTPFEEAKAIIKKYPEAYCCGDSNGFYIVPSSSDKQTILGKGRKPTKAWHNAFKKLKERKKGPKARP